jgi:O-antigen/teichoic acid export membrane protein
VWRRFGAMAGDTAWTTASEVLAMVAALVSFLLLQQVLEPEQFGAYSGLYQLATIFSAITFSGPGLALVQRRVRYNQPLDEIIESFLSLSLLAAAGSTAVAVALAVWLIGLSLPEIMVITLSELAANSIIFLSGFLIQVASGYRAMIRVRMVTVVLKILIVPALYLTDRLTILNLGTAYLVAYGLWALVLVLVILPRVGYTLRLGRPPEDAWRSSAVFAGPLAAIQIQTGGDTVALNAFNLRADAGIYAAAYRVVLLAAMPIRVVGQAAFHRFLPEGDTGVAGYHLRRAMQLSGFLFFVAWMAVAGIYALLYVLTPIMDFLISDEYGEAREVMPWLALFLPLLALSGTPLNALLGLERSKPRAVIYLTSALVSVLLYVTLIPGSGWRGAVLATLLSELFLVLAAWGALVHYQRVADRAGGGERRDAVAG